MTDEKKQVSKDEIVNDIDRLIKLHLVLLKKVDPRLLYYMEDLRDNPDLHNVFELLSLRRHLSYISKYRFNTKFLNLIILCAEQLELPPSDSIKPGQTLKLSPFQIYVLFTIYGLYKDDGKRLTKQVILYIPRKFGKTAFTAAIATLEFLFFKVYDAQVLTASVSERQAGFVFSFIKYFITHLTDNSLSHFTVNQKEIRDNRPNRTSYISCIANSPDKVDGFNPSFVVVDEYSQFDTSTLRDILVSGMGVRKSPLTMIITTASSKKDGAFYRELQDSMSMLQGFIPDLDFQAHHLFMPDEDDDPSDPVVWKKVQPHLGFTVQKEYYEEKFKEAEHSETKLLEFKSRLLNLYTAEISKDWLRESEVRLEELHRDEFKGHPYFIAVDLSVRDDLSAITYLIELPTAKIINGKKTKFISFTDYYTTAWALMNSTNKSKYRLWKELDKLKICETATIDYDYLAHDVIDNMRRFGIQHCKGIGYDRYKSNEFIEPLKSNIQIPEKKIYTINQSLTKFNVPTEVFERLALNNLIVLEDSPVSRFCIRNCAIYEDSSGNRKPVKRSTDMKIDGVITNLMALSMALDNK